MVIPKISKIEIKGAIINHIGILEYYDHLVPLSELIGLPILLLDDSMSGGLCKKFYPEAKIHEMDYHNASAAYLIANYDTLVFSSHIEMAQQYLAAEEKKQHKKVCKLFCPHGFSDKTYYWQEYIDKDFIFIYGQNMIDLFDEIKLPLTQERCIRVGHYRYEYFKKHRAHQLELAKQEVFKNLDRDKKTVFYAPTWPDYRNASTFFECVNCVIENMPSNYNLIIKAHPRLIHEFTEQYYKNISRHSRNDQVVFVEDFPLIFPLLELSDYYLGDMSSIGYDFLAFNKPMFFINKKRKMHNALRESFLFQCGTIIDPSNVSDLFNVINLEAQKKESTFSKIQKEIHEYTFGKPRTPKVIKNEFEGKIINWLQKNS